MKVYIAIDNKTYTLTYDEEYVLDTVTLKGSEECLTAKNKDVAKIVKNSDKILNRTPVKGIVYKN